MVQRNPVRCGRALVLAAVVLLAGAAEAGEYLDPCTLAADCSSGLCLEDLSGAGFCSQTCLTEPECADEHVCAGGQCVPDDTGTTCAVPGDCASGKCLVGPGLCTRNCASALDCPAGAACTTLGGEKVCVSIEEPCTGPADCATGLCLAGLGCTAPCIVPSDCPQRVPLLPAYACEVAFGSMEPICVPPLDVMGSDPIGASCVPIGPNSCRSALCDATAPAPVCTQGCNPQGGCGPDFGCVPDPSSGFLLCGAAGAGSLGESCSGGLDCRSGLCLSEGSVCTRLCEDGLCPSGFTCSGESPHICLMPEPSATLALVVAIPLLIVLSRRRRRAL